LCRDEEEPMRIAGFDLRLVTIPYAEPVEWAKVTERELRFLVLRLQTDEGLYGLAEVKTNPTWSGHSLAMTAQALREIYEPLLVGLDPLASEQVWAAIDRIPGWSPPKVLLDVALTDLASRQAGLPLWKFLGGWTDEVAVSGLLTRGPYERRLEEAQGLIERFGLRAFKVKIGKDPAADVEFVRQLRAGLGPDVLLRVDANSTYTPRQALRVAEALAELDVTLFEDPCPLGAAATRAEVFQRSAVPVLVDAEVTSLAAARQLIAEGARAMSIKVRRMGYRWGERIRQLGEDEAITTAVGLTTEGSLGALMSLHFHGAYRIFQATPSEELWFATLADDVVDERPLVRDGKVKLPARPGLGAELDPAALERLSVAV
jgi:L-alanine-DL-glutamate epimerase-like enolase superfamily enzyme